jgi:hypothetical protein
MARKSRDLPLLTPDGVEAFPSRPKSLSSHGRLLKEYLLDPFDPEHLNGRGIWAEMIGARMIQQPLQPLFHKGWRLFYTPTYMDESVKHGNEYRKGVDLCLTAPAEILVGTELERFIPKTAVRETPVAMCGIDVTVAKSLGSKLSRTGLQIPPAIPTVVLPLREFFLGERNTSRYTGFVEYLAHLAQAFAEHGEQNPFCYTTREEERIWRRLIMDLFLKGFDRSERDIRTSLLPEIQQHRNTMIAVSKIHILRRHFQEILPPPASYEQNIERFRAKTRSKKNT